ncbi:MAG: type II toxin-antitoxin system Phd/YefM family antitoxin [Deltaproteobacteria bacterium]|nr:type II toxin-antitoxin system Phd/YefM family antitoxin [Deltaproteobacteria bacterium]
MKVNIYDAKTRLSELIDKANDNQEVIIARAGRPVARLVPYVEKAAPRRLGLLKGDVWVADDFDAPLPDQVQADFDGGS